MQPLPRQRGYLWIIILFLVLPLLGLVFFQPKTTPPTSEQTNCIYNPPLTTQTATYLGAEYQLLAKNKPVIIRELIQFPHAPTDYSDTDHLKPDLINKAVVKTDGQSDYEGTPWSIIVDSDGTAQSETWQPVTGVENIIYVDISDRVEPKPDPGYKVFDIYLKAGASVPKFVQDYCDQGFPTEPIALGPLDQTETDPVQTLTFNNETFYLFSYETIDGPAHLYTLNGAKITPINLELNVQGQPKTYQAYYNPASFVRYLTIVDPNPDTAQKINGHQLVYKYVAKEFYNPTDQQPETVPAKENLQLQTMPTRNINPWGWWSPECKPAIYLYPDLPMSVRVQVKPDGFLTYTDPVYPRDGWLVDAFPTGQLLSNGKTYNYLYYESKINDASIEKPTQGYVVKKADLEKLYDQILPQLGLNQREIQDYKDYWRDIMPQANYFFVGIMSESAIEKIEPLTIMPKPDSTIRVRLYYQALDNPIEVSQPIITQPTERNGFTVVEWGGLVKNDKNHPFTCSQ